MTNCAQAVERNLSGAVLQQRSGRLAGSIAVSIDRSGAAVGATVGTDVPYAAIHEYGGTIPARQILPRERPSAGLSVAWPAAVLQACRAAGGEDAGTLVPALGAGRDGAGDPCRIRGGGATPGGERMIRREPIYAALFALCRGGGQLSSRRTGGCGTGAT